MTDFNPEQEQSLHSELALEEQHLRDLDKTLPSYYDSYEVFGEILRWHREKLLGQRSVGGEIEL